MITPLPYYAQNIQAGSSNAQTSVETNVQGDGNVSTHIEVEANGEKKVLDSNSPGTYKLDVESTGNNLSETATPTKTSDKDIKESSISARILEKHDVEKPSFLLNLENYLQDLFQKIFSNFRR